MVQVEEVDEMTGVLPPQRPIFRGRTVLPRFDPRRSQAIVAYEPQPKRRKVDTPPLIAISLPGQMLQFEEQRRDCTYCAFFTELEDGVAHEIRKAAQGLKSAGTVAFAKHGIIEREIQFGYLLVNWTGQSNNFYSQMKERLRRLNVSVEGGAGKLVWMRPMKPYLKKRLETANALVYPMDGTFWMHPSTQSEQEEKLEAMQDWAEDADLKGTVEDYVPFAEAFEERFGEYYKDDARMQQACLKTFGQCFPDMRTRWYQQEKHVGTQKAQEPIQTYDQIPPEVRVKVKGRMQPKDKDIEGAIIEGCCIECGNKADPGAQYCKKEKCQNFKRIFECNECHHCGSSNIKKIGDTTQMRQEDSITIQCNDCMYPIFYKSAGWTGGIWMGEKRKRPEYPVQDWTKRKA
jgi:hypothetical protein